MVDLESAHGMKWLRNNFAMLFEVTTEVTEVESVDNKWDYKVVLNFWNPMTHCSVECWSLCALQLPVNWTASDISWLSLLRMVLCSPTA